MIAVQSKQMLKKGKEIAKGSGLEEEINIQRAKSKLLGQTEGSVRTENSIRAQHLHLNCN